MGYDSLRSCIDDLAREGHLRRVTEEVDPYLEAAEIQRRVFARGGPALLFENVKGSRFPMASNLFGSMDRVRFIFRDALDGVRALVRAKVDPRAFVMEDARRALRLPGVAMHLLPRPVPFGAVFAHRIPLSQVPQMTSWPDDGGPFITLPQVYSEDPNAPGLRGSNLGMYRVQLAGNDYVKDHEIGLHYQIHRGLGVHHAAAIARGERLPVCVFVGGPPAMAVAAVMPLPEGLPEIAFAGALNRRSIRMAKRGNVHVHADADFCIMGSIGMTETKREGPFGDHLGYYAKAHEFPVMRVDSVHHREGAIWPFTVVGRPPQEDTMFGELIHELTGPLVPTVLPGVRAVHAVDSAGVHPLLLAVGSERYVPYAKDRRPMELLTQANAILGQGQMSLAKYLFITTDDDAPGLRIDDVGGFLMSVLSRFDPARDVHFHTNTTIDTLDYSGSGLNQGSKVVICATGPSRRTLSRELGADIQLPEGFDSPKVALPGVLVLRAPRYGEGSIDALTDALKSLEGFPLVVLTEDSEFAARNVANFTWVTFTRSNPAVDIHGVGSFVVNKGWGCRGALVIDARRKPHHAPPLIEDPRVSARVDRLGVRGASLHGLL